MASGESQDDTSLPGDRLRNRSAAERVEQEFNRRRKEDGASVITEGVIFEGLANRLLEMLKPQNLHEEDEARRLGRKVETRSFNDLKLAAQAGEDEAQETLKDVTFAAEYWLRKIAAGKPEDVRRFIKSNLKIGRIPTEEEVEDYASSFTAGAKWELEAKVIAQDRREVDRVDDLEDKDADYKFAKFLALNQDGAQFRLRQEDLKTRATNGEDVSDEQEVLDEEVRNKALTIMLYDIGFNEGGNISTKARSYFKRLEEYVEAEGIDLRDQSQLDAAPDWVKYALKMHQIYLERESRDRARNARGGDPRRIERRDLDGNVLPAGQDEEFDPMSEALAQARGKTNTYENVSPSLLPEEIRKRGFSQDVVDNFDPRINPQGFSPEQLATGARNLLMFNDFFKKSSELTQEFKTIIGARGKLLDLADPAVAKRIYEEQVRKYGAERADMYYSVHSEIAKLTLPQIRERFIEENMWKFVEEPNADWDDLKFGQVREVLHALHTVQTADERNASTRKYTVRDNDWGEVSGDDLVVRRTDAEAEVNNGRITKEEFNRRVSKIQDLLLGIDNARLQYLEALRKEKDDLFIEVIGRINLHNVARAWRTQGPDQVVQTVHTIEPRQVQFLVSGMAGVSQALNAMEESDGAYFRSHEQASDTMVKENQDMSQELKDEELKDEKGNVRDINDAKVRQAIWAIRTKIKLIKDRENVDYLTNTKYTLDLHHPDDNKRKTEADLKKRTTIIGDPTSEEGKARIKLIQDMGSHFDLLVTALYAADANGRVSTETRSRSMAQVARKVLYDRFSEVKGGIRVYKLRGVSLENVDEVADRVAEMAQQANLAMNISHKLYLMEGKGLYYEGHQWQTKEYFKELDAYNNRRQKHGLERVDRLPNIAEPTEIWFKINKEDPDRWVDTVTNQAKTMEINIYDIEKAAQYIRRKEEYEKKYLAYFGVEPDGTVRTEPKPELTLEYQRKSQGSSPEAIAFREKYPTRDEYLNYGSELSFFGLKSFFAAYPTLKEYTKGYEAFTYNKHKDYSEKEGDKYGNVAKKGEENAVWEFDEVKFKEDKTFYDAYRSTKNARKVPQAVDAAVHEFQGKNFERFNINDTLQETDYIDIATYEWSITGRGKPDDKNSEIKAALIAEGKKLAETKYTLGPSFTGKTETNGRRLFHYAGYSAKLSTHANNAIDQFWLSRTADLLVVNMGRVTANLSIQEMADTWETNFNSRKGAWDERYTGADKLRKELLSAGEQILHASNGMRHRPVEMITAYLKAVDHVKGGYEQTVGKFLLKNYLKYAMYRIKQDTYRHDYMAIYEVDHHIRDALSKGLLSWGGYKELKAEILGLGFLGADWGSRAFDLIVMKTKTNITMGLIHFLMDLIKGGAQGILVGK